MRLVVSIPSSGVRHFTSADPAGHPISSWPGLPLHLSEARYGAISQSFLCPSMPLQQAVSSMLLSLAYLALLAYQQGEPGTPGSDTLVDAYHGPLLEPFPKEFPDQGQVCVGSIEFHTVPREQSHNGASKSLWSPAPGSQLVALLTNLLSPSSASLSPSAPASALKRRAIPLVTV